MVVESEIGPLPTPSMRTKWLLDHGKDLIEESFINVLFEQFVSAASQFEYIADHFQISPLELNLDYLIQFLLNFLIFIFIFFNFIFLFSQFLIY